MSGEAYEEFKRAGKAADEELSRAMHEGQIAHDKVWEEKGVPAEAARLAAIKESEQARDALLSPAFQKKREAMQAAYDVWRRTPEYEASEAVRYLE